MRDDKRRQTLKIELLSQWKLEAEFRNFATNAMAKFATNASGTSWWQNLEIVQVMPSGGQFCNIKCK